jgi:hypothetical protein
VTANKQRSNENALYRKRLSLRKLNEVDGEEQHRFQNLNRFAALVNSDDDDDDDDDTSR